MRSKAVTQPAWQVIHQGNVPKVVFAAPVDAMRLERVTAIGDKDNHPSSRTQHPHHFNHCLAVILDMFQHFVAQDQIKGSRFKGQKLSSRAQYLGAWQTRSDCLRLASALKVVLQTGHLPGKGRQMLHIHTDPTAILKHMTCDPIVSGAQQHLQAAFLPRSPDIRWLAAARGFLHVTGRLIWRCGCRAWQFMIHQCTFP